MPIDRFTQTRPVQECRSIYEQLQRATPPVAELMRSLHGGSFTMWAPDDKATLLQMLSAFKKICAAPRGCWDTTSIEPARTLPIVHYTSADPRLMGPRTSRTKVEHNTARSRIPKAAYTLCVLRTHLSTAPYQIDRNFHPGDDW